MKKLRLYLFIFLLVLVCGLLIWQRYRFHISSPMQDIEYKKQILADSHNPFYTLEALRPLMGPRELEEFIKENDLRPEVYTPDLKNIKNGSFMANLHTHTTNSDGKPTVEMRLDSAQNYAETFVKDGYMTIAITDHNTVLGAKEVVRILQKNKGKYKNVKVVPGIEINSEYHNSKISKNPVQIHILTWCINPYNKFLNKEFYKKDTNDKWNRSKPDRDFDWVIKTMSDYGIVGIAHPARYTTSMKGKKYLYITEMFTRYSQLNPKTKFAEGYYQSYKFTSTGPNLKDEYNAYINYINNEAARLRIFRTGSTDAHGVSLFRYKDRE